MKIKVAWIGNTKIGKMRIGQMMAVNSKTAAVQALTEEYLQRISHYVPVEGIAMRDEAALLGFCEQPSSGKSSPKNFPRHKTASSAAKCNLVLLDSRGKEFSSEQFAQFLSDYQNRNPVPLVFAIGAADGFSQETLAAAYLTISLGKMTLPHELARVVLLEQVYRAFTILKRHPYHRGH